MLTSLLRVASMACLACAACLAGTWTGALVDSDCYGTLQRNTSHDAGHTGVNTKKAIRTCAVKDTTKSFSIVDAHGSVFNLDSTGQESAIAQVLKASSKAPHMVQVTGDANGNTIKVTGISKAK